MERYSQNSPLYIVHCFYPNQHPQASAVWAAHMNLQALKHGFGFDSWRLIKVILLLTAHYININIKTMELNYKKL